MSASTGSAATLPRSREAWWLQVIAALLFALSVLALLPALELTRVTALVAEREFRATVFEGGDAASEDHEPVSPWIDTSMVTPLVVDVTLLCMAYGSLCLGGWRPLPRRWIGRQTFPFPKGYRGFFVQYGLLGTVYGLILAFWNLNLSQQDISKQTQQLLTGMGAALWSTLTALVLAYVWCPLMENLYQGIARAGGHEVYVPPRNALADFVDEVEAASAAMGVLEMQAKRLAIDLGLGARVTSLQSAVETLQSRDQQIGTQLDGIEQLLAKVESRLAAQADDLERTGAKVRAVEERLRTSTDDIQAVEGALRGLSDRLREARKGR